MRQVKAGERLWLARTSITTENRGGEMRVLPELTRPCEVQVSGPIAVNRTGERFVAVRTPFGLRLALIDHLYPTREAAEAASPRGDSREPLTDADYLDGGSAECSQSGADPAQGWGSPPER